MVATEPKHIRLIWLDDCRGPDGCFSSRSIVWQADCGCWCFKCLTCGNVDHVRCYEDPEEHWAAFVEMAEALT